MKIQYGLNYSYVFFFFVFIEWHSGGWAISDVRSLLDLLFNTGVCLSLCVANSSEYDAFENLKTKIYGLKHNI